MMMQLKKDELNRILNTKLVYRDTLNLPSNVLFGIEIESERINCSKIKESLMENGLEWLAGIDLSVYSGAEVVSPVLKDEEKTWEELKIVCELMRKNHAKITPCSGGHVHVGAHVLDGDIDAFKIFLKTYMIYEPIILRFWYGEYLTGRSGMRCYANQIQHFLYDNMELIMKCDNLKEILSLLKFSNKYCAVNFLNMIDIKTYSFRNTIEFRGGNGTLEPVIWQNYVNLATKLLLFVKRKDIDIDFLDWKVRNLVLSNSLYMLYEGIDLKEMIEFVNLIFTWEIDKLYFARQYLKDMRFGYGNEAKLSRKFIK